MKHDLPALDETALQELCERVAEISEPTTVRRLFDELLTPAERRDMALRWRLLQRLQAGIPQRRIARELGVSLCKITRGSSVLKNPESVCRGMVEGKDGNRKRCPP